MGIALTITCCWKLGAARLAKGGGCADHHLPGLRSPCSAASSKHRSVAGYHHFWALAKVGADRNCRRHRMRTEVRKAQGRREYRTSRALPLGRAGRKRPQHRYEGELGIIVIRHWGREVLPLLPLPEGREVREVREVLRGRGGDVRAAGGLELDGASTTHGPCTPLCACSDDGSYGRRRPPQVPRSDGSPRQISALSRLCCMAT